MFKNKRLAILESSLEIEDALNTILLLNFGIGNNTETKTLGNKSSALSFKNKADLLYDLQKITKDEYTRLIIFMEVRNQFIHNMDSDNYTMVFRRLKKEQFFKTHDKRITELFKSEYSKTDEETEKLYEAAFIGFTTELKEMLLNQYKKLQDEFKEKQLELVRLKEAEILNKVLKEYDDTIDEVMEKVDEIWKKNGHNNTMIGDIIKDAIHSRNIEKIENLFKSNS